MMNKEMKFSGVTVNGLLMVFIELLLVVAAILFFVQVDKSGNELWLIPGFVAILLFVFLSIGYVLIEPNQACVLLFFGVYKGTIKKNGFFWVNPLFSKKKVSQRICNIDPDPIKVNDKIGNPIMIGLVLVWKIEDTYKIMFDIENDAKNRFAYEKFVRVQSDAALRKVAGMYPYDNIDDEHDNLATLRANSDEVNEKLELELIDRLAMAGIKVVEARINYLAYASEIAGAMLRRQQASAIIAAREKIVEGAVSMVELALNKLSEKEVVTLDEDKKASMVSNLMVVLCADDAAQPIINTGTLY
ncbi:SPFH domain-containing protein [Bacteroidales bacterium OttesenSCG-928-K22]|nr:SPFH domain-containing protein [Bacteroidales bacterium OttesenSCG-928-K22]